MNADKLQTNRKERNGKMEPPPSLFKTSASGGNWVVDEIQKNASWYTVEYISILTITIIKKFICHIKTMMSIVATVPLIFLLAFVAIPEFLF